MFVTQPKQHKCLPPFPTPNSIQAPNGTTVKVSRTIGTTFVRVHSFSNYRSCDLVPYEDQRNYVFTPRGEGELSKYPTPYFSCTGTPGNLYDSHNKYSSHSWRALDKVDYVKCGYTLNKDGTAYYNAEDPEQVKMIEQYNRRNQSFCSVM